MKTGRGEVLMAFLLKGNLSLGSNKLFKKLQAQIFQT